MALMFGTAGLPHILMRFFTVPDARQARISVLWATGWIGYFYILTFIIGFGAIVLVSNNPAWVTEAGALRSGNMAAIHLAEAIGGNLFLGFVSAVAFATILAVVAGLTLSGASAVSHDLYATVVRKGQANRDEELRVSRITVVVLALLAIALGIAFEKQQRRLHGQPRLRAGGVRQLPGADPVALLEGLHDARAWSRAARWAC